MAIFESIDTVVERAESWIKGSDVLDLLRRIVEIDSRWSNPAGVEAVGSTISERLETVGFDIEYVPQPSLPATDRWLAELLAPSVEYESLASTLLARRPGTGDRKLLLVGDLDTAFSHEDLGGSLFSVGEERVTGVGVADMKAGLATMVAALECVSAFGLESPPITVVLAGDEQAGSLGSRNTILAEAEGATWTLCMECARDGGNLMSARAQVGVGVLGAKGREAHAGTARDVGENAIETLCGAVSALTAPFASRHDILVTPTIISGGRRRSVVPSEARLILDLRAVDERRWNEMARGLEKVVADYPNPLLLQAAAHRPAIAEDADSSRLADLVLGIGTLLGLNHGTVGSMAAGSSAFASQGGSAVIDGMGPPGGNLMTPEEWVSTSGISERGAVLAASIHALSKGDSSRSPRRVTAEERGD